MIPRRILAALGVVPMACSAPVPTRQRVADHSAPAEDQMSAGPVVLPTTTGPADPTTTTTEAPAPATTTTYVVTVPTVPPTTTTLTLPERADEDVSDAEWWESQPGYVAGACGGSLPPCWVMRRESGGDPQAVNATGCGGRGCYGKWQFDPRTSRGLGYPLPMNQYPESVQDEAARTLWAGGRGCSHWAAC